MGGHTLAFGLSSPAGRMSSTVKLTLELPVMFLIIHFRMNLQEKWGQFYISPIEIAEMIRP